MNITMTSGTIAVDLAKHVFEIAIANQASHITQSLGRPDAVEATGLKSVE
jgi:hypothetical protein